METKSAELSPEWQSIIESGIREQLDNLHTSFVAVGDKPEAALDFSPVSVSGDADQRGWDETSQKEREFIRATLFKELNFVRSKAEVDAAYNFDPTDGTTQGKIDVLIYRTDKSNEGIYLHVTRTESGEEQFFVAPLDYRL